MVRRAWVILTPDLPLSPLMLKYAFITRTGLYPPQSGAALRNRQNIAGVAKLGIVGVFSVIGRKETTSTQLPEGLFFREKLVAGRPNRLDRFMTDVVPGRVRMADSLCTSDVLCELDRFLDDFAPDVLIAEELAVGALVKHVLRRNLPVVFDNHNFEKGIRTALVQGGGVFLGAGTLSFPGRKGWSVGAMVMSFGRTGLVL